VSGDKEAGNIRRSLKDRIKDIYRARNLDTNICGSDPIQSVLMLFELRDGFVHPKVINDEFVDKKVKGVVNNEQLSTYLSGEMDQLCSEEAYQINAKMIDAAQNKIAKDCSIPHQVCSFVIVESG
jgi:hypothetical protein